MRLKVPVAREPVWIRPWRLHQASRAVHAAQALPTCSQAEDDGGGLRQEQGSGRRGRGEHFTPGHPLSESWVFIKPLWSFSCVRMMTRVLHRNKHTSCLLSNSAPSMTLQASHTLSPFTFTVILACKCHTSISQMRQLRPEGSELLAQGRTVTERQRAAGQAQPAASCPAKSVKGVPAGTVRRSVAGFVLSSVCVRLRQGVLTESGPGCSVAQHCAKEVCQSIWIISLSGGEQAWRWENCLGEVQCTNSISWTLTSRCTRPLVRGEGGRERACVPRSRSCWLCPQHRASLAREMAWPQGDATWRRVPWPFALILKVWGHILLIHHSASRTVSATQGVCACSVKLCRTLCNPMDCSPPGSSVHGFPRQEYWSGLPFPSPGDLPDSGIKPTSPALQADCLPLSHRESPACRMAAR